jgi:hypothetical protein
MLFAWMGFLKDDQSIPQEVNQLVSSFVQQPYIDVQSFGPLWDENGKRTAMLMIFEVDDRPKAQSFVEDSPFLKAGLYEHHHLYEYRNEGG